jgi:phage major head subunit gpT-like protein
MKTKTSRAAAQQSQVFLRADADIQIQAEADGKVKRPTFKVSAYNGGALRVTGFFRPVVVDLAGLRAGAGGRVAMLKDHDPTQVCGQGIATITATGVVVEGQFTGDYEDKDQPCGMVVSHAKGGFTWAASIGAWPERTEFVDAGAKVTVNGREFAGPINVVRAARLGEVSFVAVGADETASATVAASAAERSVMFNDWLKAKGFEPDALTEAQKVSLQAAYDAEQKPAPVKAEPAPAPVQAAPVQADPVAALRASVAAEHERIASINKVAKEFPQIAAQAIRENWDVTKAELEVLRASRPVAAPAGIVRDNTVSADMIVAAACMAGNMGDDQLSKQFKPEVLDAASSRYRGRIGLQQILIEAAVANGYAGGPFAIRNDMRGVLQNAFGIKASGFSSIDIAGILSSTANKFLLEGFTAVEQSWRDIAAIRSVNDFKTVTSYRMTGDLEYVQLAPNGEIAHGTLADESFTNQAKTYAKMLGISRADIINDDLGALTQVPSRLGRGAGLKLNTVFWTAFLNNSSFFTSGRGNYQDGAATALSITSLTAAELLFLNQTDPDGKPLSIAPEILLVPNALSTTATSLTRDLELRDTTASTKYTTGNPHAGKFRPVRSSYLSNSTITGYSAAAWYLLANPAQLAAIEVCFLNGQQAPTVETADADFNTLGIQMRGYHDFGVALQEYRAGVKSKGTA